MQHVAQLVTAAALEMRHQGEKGAPLARAYLKDHGGYYVDTGLTQVSAKLRAVSQVQLMDLVSER